MNDPQQDNFIRHFTTGAQRNDATGKGRYDLIPPSSLRRLAIRYEEGAKKHGERNWEKGIPEGSLMDSAIRHLFCHLSGLQDEDHLAAAAWNIFAAMRFQDEAEGRD